MHIRIDRLLPAKDGEPVRGYRWLILTATLAAAALASANLARMWARATEWCTVPACTPPQLTAAAGARLAEEGIPLEAWTTTVMTTSAATTLVPLLLAPLVASHGTRSGVFLVPPALLVTAVGPSAAFADMPWLAPASQVSFFTLLGTYPGARFHPRWTVLPVAAALIWSLVTTLSPVSAAVAANSQPWASLYGIGFALALAGIAAALVVRFVQGDPSTRRSILLLALVLGVFACSGAMFSLYQGIHPEQAGIGTIVGSAGLLLVNVTTALILGLIALSALGGAAYGVRLAFNRVLLAVIALLIVLTVYAGAAALGSLLLHGWLPRVLATAAAALVLTAVFRPIVSGIDRLVHGDADDPYRLAARLGAALAAADDSRNVVTDLLELLADALRLPWISLDCPGTAGPAPSRSVVAHLDAGAGGAVLTIGLRARQRRLNRRDRAALRAAAPALLSALTAVRLTAELDASRRHVVIAAKEERRALRRDLHDDLGPSLAAARHRIAAARADAGDAGDVDPDSHLGRAEHQLVESIETVRALARRLRPPALDEHGLYGALEAAAGDLGLAADIALDPIDLPDRLEVGVYRIALEALTNVARHSHATQVHIGVTRRGDELALEVADNGIGITGDAIGVGIASMRERAAELGGRVTITGNTGGGALVVARLPLSVGGTA